MIFICKTRLKSEGIHLKCSVCEMAEKQLLSVDFEVFGRVQGVFFRKFTKMKAKELGLRGWVKNTRAGTVVGQLQGEQPYIHLMKEWLRTQGSPHSRIEKCNFKDEKHIDTYGFDDFKVTS